MNQEIKKQWIQALLSGEYPQDIDYLKTETGYCCLGVLCELAVKANVIPPSKRIGNAFWYSNETVLLPDKVAQWAGINPQGLYEEGGCLSQENDQGATFEQLAQNIEKYF